MRSSLKLAVSFVGFLLACTVGSVEAQTRGSRATRVLLENVSPATRSAIVEAQKDLLRRTARGAIKTDTPLSRSCNFLLGDAARIHDEHRVLDTSFHALRFREWMCQSGFRSRDELSDAATALDMVNPDFGSMLGYMLKEDRTAFARQMAQFCTAGYELYVDPAARENFERQARASMTDAYRTCLGSAIDTAIGKSGVFAYATPEDRSLQRYTVDVHWQPAVSGGRPRVIRTEGARCHEIKSVGSELKLDCMRTRDGTGVVVVAAAAGSETVLLPGLTEMARVALEERLLILRDRIHVLEEGLSKVSPALLADLRDAARQ